MAYHGQQGVDTAIVRIFNTYGPRMRPNDGRAVPTFVRQALEGKPLTVFGDGTQTRSFCYVDDLIRGLVLLAESGEHLPVNIGNPAEFTLNELAEKVLRITGSKSEVVYEALPVDDPRVVFHLQAHVVIEGDELHAVALLGKVQGARRGLVAAGTVVDDHVVPGRD